ncbi:MAG: hypothetical protein E7616_05395 [Ruminococcaceae bacterium]|nr:hypothetical protein [Oscillospiraceae bacterium]
MDFWIFLISLFALIVLYPYLRMLIKRLIMVIKLKRMCHRKRLKLHPAHLFWMFGDKIGTSCDFYIETQDEILSIKLFGVKWRLATLCFTEGGEYYFKKYFALVSNLGGMLRMPLETMHRKMHAFHFRHRFKEEWELKTTKNILLIHPVCHEIYYIPIHGPRILLGAGDIVYGYELYSLSPLMQYLEVPKNADSFSLAK